MRDTVMPILSQIIAVFLVYNHAKIRANQASAAPVTVGLRWTYQAWNCLSPAMVSVKLRQHLGTLSPSPKKRNARLLVGLPRRVGVKGLRHCNPPTAAPASPPLPPVIKATISSET
jgi:hypothetical protein